jgi:hypothetical protein
MIFLWEYDVKVLKTIIIIIHYNMNNFITSYDNIIVHYCKSWNNNNFNFFKWIRFLNKIQLFIFSMWKPTLGYGRYFVG